MSTWNPADYNRNSGEQQKWAKELIGKIQFRGDERVLDVGCGDGKVTAEIAALVKRGRVTGLDSSKQMIDFANRAFPRLRFSNLSFVVGDAANLQYSQQFDLVFSNAALHWIHDHRPVLAGICHALRPGGRMVAQMGGKGCASDVLEQIDVLMAEPRWEKYFENFTFRYGFHSPRDYRQWLAEAGLEAVRVELFSKDMAHAGREGFAGWVRTTWIPYTQAVDEAHRAEFIEELVSRYVKSHPADAEGLVHVKMMRLEVEAVRKS
jgi:trans-aconitate 2-methyltransferase